MYIEWSLLPISTTIPFATPLAMSIAAIQRFRPSHLYDPPPRVGDAGAVRPPEATYQDEFYRSILEVTGGCVRISSEYSSASVARPGRVVPSKKWGVELFHDGNKVREHSSHFLMDADYVILDLRCTRPQKSDDGELSFCSLALI